jgi:hypothetical protein
VVDQQHVQGGQFLQQPEAALGPQSQVHLMSGPAQNRPHHLQLVLMIIDAQNAKLGCQVHRASALSA